MNIKKQWIGQILLHFWRSLMIIAVLNLCGIHILGRGTALSIRVNLTVSLAVETAATQTKPAYAGFSNLDFPLVRAGGLGFYSRDSVAGRASVHFQSPGLKLTPMGTAVPLLYSMLA